MSNVLVVLEFADGKLKSSCLPGITCAKQIAEANGGELHFLVLAADPAPLAEAVANAGLGATTVHTMGHAAFEPFTAEAWADGIVAAVRATNATVVGGTASSSLRDALPRAAALLDAPLTSEVTAVGAEGVMTRPISAGRALLDQVNTGAVSFFTARGSEFPPVAGGGAAASIAALTAAEISTRGTAVVEIQKTQSTRPALSEAEVVVSGGRGMREGENFKVLEELTDLLGGALGASRAATDAGMVPADLQVGQTGKIVAPNLYIAVAISGAIQHLAGMKGSKTIVAVNKDEEAPIFQVADYGLVGKWEDELPKILELVKAAKAG
ncbi:MAG: electron transfer flavoprotein subunit alpha/FixB family protein [Nannocystaceae bacterium]